MSQPVDGILRQIECLDEADRILLEQRLQERAEAEWREQAEIAREVARRQGIHQQSIDRAVEEVCYGP